MLAISDAYDLISTGMQFLMLSLKIVKENMKYQEEIMGLG